MTQLKLAALLSASCESCPVSSGAPLEAVYSVEEDTSSGAVTEQIFFLLSWVREGLLQYLCLPHTDSNHV